MAKSLNISTFEQVFAEKTLEKGLKLFRRKNGFEVIKQATGQFTFTFFGVKASELSLKKTVTEIRDYSCSCDKKLCEHICAAIFYFQNEVAEKIESKTKSSAPTKLFKNQLTDLNKIVKGVKDEKLLLEKVTTYCKKVRQENSAEYFSVCLAAICTLTDYLSQARHIAVLTDEYIDQLKQELLKSNLKKLSLSNQEILLEANKLIISNYKKFETGTYFKLIPLSCIAISNKKRLTEIKLELSKRNIKQFYSGNLNKKLISIIQLDISSKIKSDQFEEYCEYSIAYAELQLVNNKTDNALKILKEGYEKLLNGRPANFGAFIEYCIEFSATHKNPALELFFIKQFFFQSPQLPLHILERFPKLFETEEQCNKETDAIIKELKLQNRENSFEKISDILFHQNRLDDLVLEIKRQKNKFWLLNKVAIKKLPFTDEILFAVYAEQFGNAINEARETHYQEYIFNYGSKYFTRLKTDERKKLLEMMLGKTGPHSYIRSFMLNNGWV